MKKPQITTLHWQHSKWTTSTLWTRYGSTQKLAYHRHSPSRNQLTKRRRLSTRCSLLRLWTTRTYLTSKRQNASRNRDLGITLLISRRTLYPKTAKSTRFHHRNKSNWTNSSTKTWQKDTFDHRNLPWLLPSFFVNKKDGKLRPCQDYRKLNEGTIKN